MKKAKMLLAAIATFAIVGGVVAFKAKGISSTFYSYATIGGQVGCLSTFTLESIAVAPGTPGATPLAAATSSFVTSNPLVCATLVVPNP